MSAPQQVIGTNTKAKTEKNSSADIRLRSSIAFKIVSLSILFTVLAVATVSFVSMGSFSDYFGETLQKSSDSGAEALKYVVEKRLGAALDEAEAFASSTFVSEIFSMKESVDAEHLRGLIISGLNMDGRDGQTRIKDASIELVKELKKFRFEEDGK